MEPKVSLPKRPILLCRTSIVLDGDKSDIRERARFTRRLFRTDSYGILDTAS